MRRVQTLAIAAALPFLLGSAASSMAEELEHHFPPGVVTITSGNEGSAGIVLNERGLVLTPLGPTTECTVTIPGRGRFHAVERARDPEFGLRIIAIENPPTKVAVANVGHYDASSSFEYRILALEGAAPLLVRGTLSNEPAGLASFLGIASIESACTPAGTVVVDKDEAIVALTTDRAGRGGLLSVHAIPIDIALDVARQLERSGKRTPGCLSATLVELAVPGKWPFEGMQESGAVLVRDVAAGGAAARAGLEAGDVLISCDGRLLFGRASLDRRIAAAGPRRALVIEALHRGARQSFTVTLDGDDSHAVKPTDG